MKKIVLISGISSLLLANPTNPVLVQGEGSFRSDGNTLEVTVPDKSIIDWHAFSIGADETTRFLQPDTAATVLNRVTGAQVSQIDGLLEANGRVILVNPNGVIVSSSGVIHAADFIAATYDLIDINDGSILKSAPEMNLSSTINMDGIIRATGLKGENGSIFLVAENVNVGGELHAPAGRIEIFGDQLKIAEGSLIDASGFGGGGTIAIGNKQTSLVHTEKGALILSDATSAGNGGTVEFWGGTNSFFGKVSSQGGAEKGDGGFVEISGETLFFDGIVDRRAPFGKPGLLYLDPTNITIGAATTGGPTIGNPTTWTGPSPVSIMATAIGAALDLGDVTINTASPIDQGDAGTISITMDQGSTIAWSMMPSTLTLIATDLISIQGEIIAATAGNINLTAPTITIGSAANALPVTIQTDGIITTNASLGMSVIGGVAVTGTVTITNTTLAPININVSSGDLNVSTDGGRILIGGTAMCGPIHIDVLNGSFLLANNLGGIIDLETNDFFDFNVSQNFQVAANADNIFFTCNSSTGNPSAFNVGIDCLCNTFANGDYTFDFMNSFLTMNVGRDMTLGRAGSPDGGFSPLSVGGIFDVGRDLSLSSSGMGGVLSIQSAGPLTVNVGNNATLDNSSPVGSVAVFAQGPLNMNVGNDILIQGVPTLAFLPAALASGISVDLVVGGSATIGTLGTIRAGFGSPGSIFINANQNIIMGPNSSLDTFGGSLTSVILVVDNQAPAAPQIGGGFFFMDSTAIINSGPLAPIQIFTARRSQNTVSGMINGFSFAPGTFGISSATEQWGFYFPQAFVGSPFTIFYKEPGVIPIIINTVDETIGTLYDLLDEFASPLPYFNDQFCITYQGSDFANGLYSQPLGAATLVSEGAECPWIQVDNYRKYYPSLQRWGYLSEE